MWLGQECLILSGGPQCEGNTTTWISQEIFVNVWRIATLFYYSDQ